MSKINLEINALVQADIDGVITPEERSRLQEHLDASEEVRAFYVDCQRLSQALDDLEELDPPPGLDNSILSQAQELGQHPEENSEGGWRSLFSIWFKYPVLHYATAFLIGALVTTLFSERAGETNFGQAMSLAGTMSPAPEFSLVETQHVERMGTNLRFDLLRANELLQLRFEVDSDSPIELEVRFSTESYGLFGFSQQPGALKSLNAGDGELVLQSRGEQGFAVFLTRSAADAEAIELLLSRDGEIVETLRVSP